MGLCLLGIGLGVGLLVGRTTAPGHAAIGQPPNGSLRTRLGPWGELSYTPFTIAAPDEVLPVRSLEALGTHWLLPKTTPAEFSALLTLAGVSAAQRDTLLDPAVLQVVGDGLDLQPPFELLRGLAPPARTALYQKLAEYPENNLEITFLHKSTLDERFTGSGVSRETLALFKELCCEHGDYLVFSGLASMLAHLPGYEEKLHFLKALTRQKTMLLRLNVQPDSDLAALALYWGRGSYASDLRTILQSVASVPGGAWLDISTLLPPLPSAELYTYPTIPDNPLNGPAIPRDCHWTSLNFFRDTPDPRCAEPGYVMEQLRTNYAPAVGDPRYGDVILFSRPDGYIIHSAVYIADDLVFTKNGSTVFYPWMLSTISDLTKRYSFSVPKGQSLRIMYFRSKSL